MADESIKKVLLMIADISGYTEFMVSEDLEIEHRQQIISQLIKSIIEQVNIPLEIAKLEGDAVFHYAIKLSDAYTWEDVRKSVGEKLIQFLRPFITTRRNAEKGFCACGACSNIDILKLKIVVHSGEALFYTIQQFCELSGKDVIIDSSTYKKLCNKRRVYPDDRTRLFRYRIFRPNCSTGRLRKL